MFKFIEEANELFPQKPYELGAKKSREIFAKHSKSLENSFGDKSLSIERFTSNSSAKGINDKSLLINRLYCLVCLIED